MTPQFDFSADTEFTKLLERSSHVDLPRVALELARDAYPNLDFSQTFEWLEARAEELAQPVARAPSESAILRALAECLATTHGLRGEHIAYSQANSSYLQCVIRTRIGIPISLSIIYMAVAQRLHIKLQGVSAPLHFITRCDTLEGPLYLDAFSGGRILNQNECLNWIGSMSGISRAQLCANLKPVENRSIIIRMLNNLKALYTRQEDWRAAWRVQRRLTALQPDLYQERRDLGLIALKSCHPGEAIEWLESCLTSCAADERAVLQQNVDEARQQLAGWN